MVNNKKPLFYLVGLALLALLVKYSDGIFHAIQLLFSIFIPVMVGISIAYVLNILVVKLEKLPALSRKESPLYRSRRAVSILGSLVVITAVVVLLVKIIIPQLLDAFSVVFMSIPPMLSRLADWIASMDVQLPQIEQWLNSLDVNWPQMLQKAVTYLTSGVSNVFTSAVSVVASVGGGVVQAIISFIFALYFLTGKEQLAAQFRALAEAYLKEKTRVRLLEVLETAHDTFTKFFVGQFIEAIVIGVLCTVGMWLFRFPYATMIGTLVGATALLPVVGAYLGAFIGAFMIFTVSPMRAVAFVIFIVILQQLEGNLIYPRVVGSSIGLPGVWVLMAVTVGGGIGGIIGILLAVPVAATCYKLLQKDVHQRKNQAVPQEHGEASVE